LILAIEHCHAEKHVQSKALLGLTWDEKFQSLDCYGYRNSIVCKLTQSYIIYGTSDFIGELAKSTRLFGGRQHRADRIGGGAAGDPR
jgi:hypothetical protein